MFWERWKLKDMKYVVCEYVVSVDVIIFFWSGVYGVMYLIIVGC